jgi:hypothetical protein
MTTTRAYDQCVTDLIEDPAVTGDLLLIGFWLARAVHLGEPAKWTFWRCAYDVIGPGVKPGTLPAHHLYRVKEALRNDIPRYDPFADNPDAGNRCSAPMIRRAGRCDRSPTVWGFETDPATGRSVYLGACRRHHGWHRERAAENAAALKTAGDHVPAPAANVGGALARHLPQIRWPNVWRRLSPDWQPPAEGTSTQRPALAVHVTEVVDFEPAEAATRPALTVHEGGWGPA